MSSGSVSEHLRAGRVRVAGRCARCPGHALIERVDGPRILRHGLGALDGTPVIDVKPVLDPVAER